MEYGKVAVQILETQNTWCMKDFCVILMFDQKFLKKSWVTIQQLRQIGKYKGDICCIIANNLQDRQEMLYKDANTIILTFPQYDTSPIRNDSRKASDLGFVSFPMKAKMIHYHKFYAFHKYFRDNYRKCFYIDTNTQIYKSIEKMSSLDCTGKLLAHSNAYPDYHEGDKMYTQFDKVIYPDLYAELNELYDLNVDHFQATVMLYDTSIIEYNTFDTLVWMAYRYVNCKTNDQGILNLYFGCIKHCWQQFPIKDEQTYYYDFYTRGELTPQDYIMVKYPKR